MAEYLPISGVVKVDPSHLNGYTGVLEGIAALGIATQFLLKQSALVEIVYNGNRNGTFLRYTSKIDEYAEAKDRNADDASKIKIEPLEARGKDLQDAEAKMRSLIAFELARYFAAAETSPHAEETVPIGKELSDLLR